MKAPVDEILIETTAQGYRAASLAQGALRDLAVEPADRRLAPGSLHLARVARIVPQIGAFLDLEGGLGALMDVPGRPPEQGALLRVQIAEAPSGDKRAKATRNLSFAGRYAVLSPGGRGVSISKRLTGPKREPLAALAGKLAIEGEGLVLRVAAAYAPPERVAGEVVRLRQIAAQLGEDGAEPKLLWADDAFCALLRTLAPQDAPAIFADTLETLRLARLGLGVLFPDAAANVARAADAALFERPGVADVIATLDSVRVDLAGGAWIAIEPTAALVAIDVNLGRSAKTPVEVNVAAAREIARQLRLRDLGGLVAIDFLRMPKPGERTRVSEALKHATQSDRRRVDVLGFTPGGIVEATRARARGGALD